MRARLSVIGSANAQDELVALRDWLSRDDDLRGRTSLEGLTPAPGQLGTGFDVLTVTVELGGLTALTDTIVAWLQTRRSKLGVTMTDSAGNTVEITAEGRIANSLAQKLDLDG